MMRQGIKLSGTLSNFTCCNDVVCHPVVPVMVSGSSVTTNALSSNFQQLVMAHEDFLAKIQTDDVECPVFPDTDEGRTKARELAAQLVRLDIPRERVMRILSDLPPSTLEPCESFLLDSLKEGDGALLAQALAAMAFTPDQSIELYLSEEASTAPWEGSLKDAVSAWAMTDFMTFLSLMDKHYAETRQRGRILILITSIFFILPYDPAEDYRESFMAMLPSHPFLQTLLLSLLLDTSNKLFPLAIRTMLMCLPFAPALFTPKVPLMMVVLGRALCWRDRPFKGEDVRSPSPTEHGPSLPNLPTLTPGPNPNLNWNVATSLSVGGLPDSMAPQEITRLLLIAMHGCWPSNMIAFVRDPVSYITGKGFETVYDVPWKAVWEPGVLAKRAAPLLQDFHLHPSVIFNTSATELVDIKRWEKIDPSQLVATAQMLAHTGRRVGREAMREGFMAGVDTVGEDTPQPSGTNTPLPGLSMAIPQSLALSQIILEPEEGEPANEVDRIRRENELLRLELRFVGRQKAQYLHHIDRLHKNSVRFISEEAEVHSFYNRLKDQRTRIASLTADLHNQRIEMTQAKDKHTKWQEQLRDKLSGFREEKKNWQSEAMKLRGDLDEYKTRLQRHEEELALVKSQRFSLQNQLTEAAPKIRHIADYETRMEQLTQMQELWDEDVRKYKETRRQMNLLMGNWKQMEQMLRSVNLDRAEQGKTISSLESQIAKLEQKLNALEPKVVPQPVPRESSHQGYYRSLAEHAKRRAEEREREVLDLQVEVEALRAERAERGKGSSLLYA